MPQDTAPDSGSPDAFLRASRTRVVVVGGGIAGLVAALEWAKIGANVTVLDAAEQLGGCVETLTLDDLPVDVVADAFALGSPALAALLDELHLSAAVEPLRPRPVWIAPLAGGAAAPLPADTVLGIPANTWADDVRRIIGWSGVWRAYLDRLRPPLTIGHERSLGNLVRTRMGDRVVDRLVAPVTRGLYGIGPDEVDVDVAAPGLSAALTRAGSLAGAVAQLLPESDAAPTRATLRRGMGQLVDALVARLTDLGAELRTGVRVIGLARSADEWAVELEPAADEPDAGESALMDAGADAAPELHADIVIVATDASPASALLRSVAVATAPGRVTERDVVTLVVDAPQLDAAPRGRAVYPVPTTGAAAAAPGTGTPRVVAVAQPTAEAAWLAEAAGPGRHVLRVTLEATAGADPESVTAAARAGASELLGIPLPGPRAVAHRRVAVTEPASALGHAQRVADVRAAVAARPGLAVVGAWIAGSGLARVVTDATAEVDRLRSSVLWGPSDPSTPS